MFQNYSKNKLGFTLIELLVVIAIIGILSSVVLASLSGARSSARDTAKIQKIDQIKTALEMYYNENGEYPNEPELKKYIIYSAVGEECGREGGGMGDSWCDTDGSNDSLEDLLSPYISKLPRPEIFDSKEYVYHSQNGEMYGLGVKLESPTGASKNDGGYYDSRYEVGQLPPYCMNKYSGTDRRWDLWSGTNCDGGS